MPAPFAEFVVPPVIHTVGLLVVGGTLLAVLYGVRPPLTQGVVLALVPWMVAGAVLHVFWQLDRALVEEVVPSAVEPLFSAPAVYLGTFCLLAPVWLGATLIAPTTGRAATVARYVGAVGIGVAVTLIGFLLFQAQSPALPGLDPVAPTLGLVVSIALTAVVYLLVGIWRTDVLVRAKYVGGLVLFAHLFDGITTAVGVELLDVGERSALPQAIMNVAAGLPTADLLGEAWLFVLVKLLLAVAIVVGFADYLSEAPTRGNLFFTVVAAVGLGPAVHNFFLFVLNLPG